MITSADVVVVGGGPAGLAAALSACQAGAQVVVLDEGAQLGGQFWRRPLGVSLTVLQPPGWARLRRLFDQHQQSIDWRSHCETWRIERSDSRFVVRATSDGKPQNYSAAAVVLCTGAYERLLPFPGWTLLGVVGAGAAQTMAKAFGVPVGQRVVVTGAGPFLLAAAAELTRGGATVVSVIDSGSPSRFLRHPVALLLNPGKVIQGVGYLVRLRRLSIPYHSRSVVVEAHGSDSVDSVTVGRLDRDGHIVEGSEDRLTCDVVAVGHGFVPQVELASQVHCRLVREGEDRLRVWVDELQRTSVAGILAAGEVCGVGGADLAVMEGLIAGETAAAGLAHAKVSGLRRLRLHRRRIGTFQRALHDYFVGKDPWLRRLRDDTVICRCEGVSVADVRTALSDVAVDARSLKLHTRVGMGPCQGRFCGASVCSVMADVLDEPLSEDALATFSRRPMARPQRVGLLAVDLEPEPPRTPAAE